MLNIPKMREQQFKPLKKKVEHTWKNEKSELTTN